MSAAGVTCAAGVTAGGSDFSVGLLSSAAGVSAGRADTGVGRRIAVGVGLAAAGEGSASGASVRFRPAFTELRPMEKPKAKNTAHSTTRATKMPRSLLVPRVISVSCVSVTSCSEITLSQPPV